MAQNKKLYRLPEQGKLFGVAAGFADYYDFDVTLVRIILVVLVVAGAGFIIPVYLVLALILPTPGQKQVDDKNIAENVKENFNAITQDLRDGESGDRARNVFGIALIVVGVWILAFRLIPEFMTIRWDIIWPVTLVLLGVMVLLQMGRKR